MTMQQLLWIEAREPMDTPEPTCWLADEDIFLLPFEHVKVFFSAVAVCESMRREHRFRIWTQHPEQRQRHLDQLQRQYDDLTTQPNVVALFTFPSPFVDLEVWGPRTLFPAMTLERQSWLQSLQEGDLVTLVQRTEHRNNVEKICQDIVSIQQASSTDLTLERCDRLIPKKYGYEFCDLNTPEIGELWITPLEPVP